MAVRITRKKGEARAGLDPARELHDGERGRDERDEQPRGDQPGRGAGAGDEARADAQDERERPRQDEHQEDRRQREGRGEHADERGDEELSVEALQAQLADPEHGQAVQRQDQREGGDVGGDAGPGSRAVIGESGWAGGGVRARRGG